MKTPKQLERYFKGAANHWRITILSLVDKNERIAVEVPLEGSEFWK